MSPSENVVDLTLFRKRRQARITAELMWAMYASRMGLAAFTVQSTTGPGKTRQA